MIQADDMPVETSEKVTPSSVDRALRAIGNITSACPCCICVSAIVEEIDGAVAAEREACAALATTVYAKDAFHFELGTAVADAIRARNQQPDRTDAPAHATGD